MLFNALHYFLSFIFVISILVFVHEMGHYLAAKFAGVKVDKFAIGMGKTILSWQDKSGTKWCINCLPIGGYVQMYGDAGAASNPDQNLLTNMSDEEKKNSFYFKSPLVKAWIAFAGPLMNYIFAAFLLTILYLSFGTVEHSSLITKIVEDGPASKAGVKIGDEIVSIGSLQVNNFADVSKYLGLYSHEKIFTLVVKRGEELLSFEITPTYRTLKTEFGEERQVPMIGVASDAYKYIKLGVSDSLIRAVKDCYEISAMTVVAIKQIVTGQRGLEDLSGPIKIAEYSGKTMKKEIGFIIWFLAMLSINLGFVNLLPLPALDGGHIILNLVEFFAGKKVKNSVQEILFKIGFGFLMLMMILITIKDILGLL